MPWVNDPRGLMLQSVLSFSIELRRKDVLWIAKKKWIEVIGEPCLVP